MKRLAVLICVSLLILSSSAFSQRVADIDPQQHIRTGAIIERVPDRFIVVLKNDVAVDHARDMQAPIALSHLDGFDDIARAQGVMRIRPQFIGSDRGAGMMTPEARALARHYKVTIEGTDLDEAMAAYERHPLVDHVEPINMHAVYATPNDGYYSYQWHYFDNYGVDADLAWDSEAGDASVLVGVLDTGVKYDHGDLGGSNPPGPNDNSSNGNIWVNSQEIPGNGIDDDGNGYIDDIIGWDFVERTDWYIYSCIDLDCGGADNDPFDGNGHGTHVAGTIAAITNNGYAVAGVTGGWNNGSFSSDANGVKVVPCRIGYTIRYSGYEVGVVIMDYVAEAMYYMAGLKARGDNVAAINCSFGNSNSGGLGAATDYLIAQDVMVIVAAGNDNSSSSSYLGGRSDCMAVGATDSSGNPASFSNYGSWVDVAAPGVDIYSTYCDPGDPGTDYIAAMDGTSMSCPHAVAVAALLESADPSLSAQDKFNLMVGNTSPYNQTKYVGAGIVNAKKALDAIGPVENPPVAEFSGSPTSGDAPLTVTFTDLSSNGPTSWSWDFGDGVGVSSDQNPIYTYSSAGTYDVTLVATNAYGSDTEIKYSYISATEPGQTVKSYALNDVPVSGTVAGDYTATHASDNVYETITEIAYAGHPVKTYSYLEHKWTFNVSGSNATFYVEAYRPANGDGDNFVFQYSTDGSNFYNLVTVASATEQTYSAAVPASGTVYVRVVDSDRAWGNTSLDPVYIDCMYIESGASAAPPVADFSGSPTSGYAPLEVSFTDLSSSNPTSWSWDFGDGVGTSSAQHPSYTYGSAGTYTVTLVAANEYGSDTEIKTGYITVSEMTGTTVHVADISVTRRIQAVFSIGQAYVTVVDQGGAPVGGAVVYGYFDEPSTAVKSGTTGGDGTVLIEADKTKGSVADFCFTVTDIVASGATYDSNANEETKACESGTVYGEEGSIALLTSGPPAEFSIDNFPNPFNPVTMIRYALPSAARVKIDVFNVKGELLAVLVDEEKGAGIHYAEWNASGVASGLYFYRMKAGSFEQTKKMILLR